MGLANERKTWKREASRAIQHWIRRFRKDVSIWQGKVNPFPFDKSADSVSGLFVRKICPSCDASKRRVRWCSVYRQALRLWNRVVGCASVQWYSLVNKLERWVIFSWTIWIGDIYSAKVVWGEDRKDRDDS